MAMGGALEFIQRFNNPKIIDAPDSSLQEGKLHSGWKPLIILRDLLQLPNCSLNGGQTVQWCL